MGTTEWTSVLIPLALVMVAAVAAWWLVRRGGGRWTRKGPVEIVQVLPLGARERVLLVRVADEYLLLGATPTHINLLQRLAYPPQSVQDATSAGTSKSPQEL